MAVVTRFNIKRNSTWQYNEWQGWDVDQTLNPQKTLKWRHTQCNGVSNHQRLECLLNCLFRRRSKKTSNIGVTGLCEGIQRWQVDFPHKGPVTRKIFSFDDVIMTHYILPSWVEHTANIVLNQSINSCCHSKFHYQNMHLCCMYHLVLRPLKYEHG